MKGFDLGSPDWWLLADRHPVTATIMFAFAAVAVAYLRFDATVWADLAAVFRWLTVGSSTPDPDDPDAPERINPVEFARRGATCWLCSTYWVTIAVLILWGPVAWLATNGAFLLLGKAVPFLVDLEPPPDLLDSAQAADMLEVDEGWLIDEAVAGRIPARWAEDHWLFSRPALVDWAAAQPPVAPVVSLVRTGPEGGDG